MNKTFKIEDVGKKPKEIIKMTKKNLIIHLEVELEMKKDNLKRSKERLEKYEKQEDEFGTGYENGVIFELENEIDILERLLKEVK